MSEVNIIEVDQWTSTGDMKERDFDTLELKDIEGGDCMAARMLFGGRFIRRIVPEIGSPMIGSVWFRKGADGKCELWKFNYDSSD